MAGSLGQALLHEQQVAFSKLSDLVITQQNTIEALVKRLAEQGVQDPLDSPAPDSFVSHCNIAGHSTQPFGPNSTASIHWNGEPKGLVPLSIKGAHYNALILNPEVISSFNSIFDTKKELNTYSSEIEDQQRSFYNVESRASEGQRHTHNGFAYIDGKKEIAYTTALENFKDIMNALQEKVDELNKLKLANLNIITSKLEAVFLSGGIRVKTPSNWHSEYTTWLKNAQRETDRLWAEDDFANPSEMQNEGEEEYDEYWDEGDGWGEGAQAEEDNTRVDADGAGEIDTVSTFDPSSQK